MTKTLRIAVACVGLLWASAAAAAEAPHTLGVGYKIGNGLGFLGADAVLGVGEHLSLGLQANYFSDTSELGDKYTGYGVLPFVQYRFRAPGSSPYLSAGPLYAHVRLNDVTAAAYGAVLNAGWEWIWSSGIAINVGAGASYLGKITATDGFTTVERGGGVAFNIEAALRYYFF
ncbi:MAG: hypothetical protein SF187_04570 [Deltaproteobacteria bacterium]|nr:hypothetical protein [Deltaproteobacteria bacterium]